jgi:peptidoglycan/LPS O-acetylase OafA/YrhL
VLLVLVDRPDGWWRFFLFAQELSPQTAGAVNPVWWSLVVEVQFYAALPLLAWLVAKVAGGSAGTAATFLAFVAAASYAFYALDPVTPGDGGGSLPATLFYFVAGMLVALAGVEGRRIPHALPAAAALWIAVFADYDLAPLAAVASGLVVAAPPPAPRALALLGVISYSLYVWHLAIVEQLHRKLPDLGFGGLLTIALAASIAVAAASYVIVEAPPLRLRRRWFRASPAPERSSGAVTPRLPRKP